MADKLTFNTFDIADDANGDIYSRINDKPGKLDTVDVVFNGSAGRTIKVIGNQNNLESSNIISYGNGNIFGKQVSSIKTFSSYDDYLEFITDLEEFFTDETKLIGDITDRYGTFYGYHWDSFNFDSGVLSTPNCGSTGLTYRVAFSCSFSKYYV